MTLRKTNKLEFLNEALGFKFSPVKIWKKFVPLPFDKYVSVNFDPSDYGAAYPLFFEVAELILPPLNEMGLRLVDTSCFVVDNNALIYRPMQQLEINQAAHLINNSILHVTNHNWSDLVSRNFDVKTVTISNEKLDDWQHPIQKKGYIKDEEIIKPEDVAIKILKALGSDYKIRVKSIHVGELYTQNVSEVVPNFVPNELPASTVAIRYDWYQDAQKTINILNKFGPQNCIVITDQSIPDEALQFMVGVNTFKILANKELSESFLSALEKRAIKYDLIYFGNDLEELSRLKLKFFDFKPVQHQPKPQAESLPKFKKIKKNTRIKTRKYIHSINGVFASEAHFKTGIDISRPEGNIVGELKDSQEFLNEYHNLYFYEIK